MSGTRRAGQQGLAWKLKRQWGPDGAGGIGWRVLWRGQSQILQEGTEVGAGLGGGGKWFAGS